LQFTGIAPELCCFIGNHGCVEIRVIYHGEPWDILIDFDVSESRTSSGQYFCRECERHLLENGRNEQSELFSSREELWEKHCFNPLLEWVNTNFTDSQWLCLGGVKNHYSEASLKQKEEVDEMRTNMDFVYACPVVQ